MTNLTQKEIEEFDEKFEAIQCDDPYCGTWIGRDNLSGEMYQLADIKSYLSQKKAEWQAEVVEAIPNEVDGDSEVDILKVKQNLKSQFKGKENND